MATTVLKPSVEDLNREREGLLARVRMAEAELRDRAEEFLLTPEEARVLRRLDEIGFLLGED